MKKILPLAFLIALASLEACKTDRSSKTVDLASPAAAKAQLDVLRDSVDVRWTQMIASDDAKISATRQVLRELANQPGVDRAQLQQLTRANDRLKNVRYNQQTMANSAQIDAYDAAQDSLLHVLYPIAQPTSGQSSELVRNLTEGIQSSDSEVVGYRLRYDQAAKQFNNYLQVHQEQFSKLGGKYSKLQPLPLFELQQ
ncbi:hypothetical protein [Hymenobacter sp. GOD-10R]|uniref:hypothetical protein n=1 Tax=Hymenobacter sp. GOD-10R TaxID=3093922 RepID=UPI002D79CC7C|nr:hypothetical protein [Hymenobacter sp. GOD-10R]WRQ30248.1 hypothetical protein SD425_08235 [Hymenobacter sp. GOD-10R]